jgi:hypothetical protein
MRRKLIKILKGIETSEVVIKNIYSKYSEVNQCFYNIEEVVEMPNYRYLFDQYKKELEKESEDTKGIVSENALRAELRRMEADGLIMIGIQDAHKNMYPVEDFAGPEYEDNPSYTVESIILTTRGKSRLGYWWGMFLGNPFAAILSFGAFLLTALDLLGYFK